MTAADIWNGLEIKLIAILRGIKPEETAHAIEALLDAGFRAIEIPLNSPDPLVSIQSAVEVSSLAHAGECLIGAGTVLDTSQVEAVCATGANLIVSPNVDPEVIRSTVSNNAFSAPGVFSPTEALLALKCGAHALKFFPSSILGPSGVKAISAILPKDTEICAVGGVGDAEFEPYLKAGATGFGLGSSLYAPGINAETLHKNAQKAVEAYRQASV